MATHWKALTNPDYIGAYAFQPNEKKIGTIKIVKREMVTGTDGKKEECTVVHFVENLKPLILNVTNAKMIQRLYNTPYIENWVGKKIQMSVKKIKAFGDVVDAVRIDNVKPEEEKPINCEICRATITAFGALTADQVAQGAKKKYGKCICIACGKKLKEKAEQNSSAENKGDSVDESDKN